MSNSDTIFGAAKGTIDEVQQIVQSQLDITRQYGDEAFQKATTAIDALMTAPPGAITSDEEFLVPPPGLVTLDADAIKGALGLVDFPGPVEAGTVASPSLNPDYEPSVGTAPVFTPSIIGVTVPAAPGPIDTSGLPTRPNINTSVAIPDSPAVALPAMDFLEPVVIPDFTFPTLPIFDATSPEFEGTFIGSVLNWEEPEYQIEILDEVMAQVRRYFAGGTGIPAAVERALFERAVDRDNLLVDRAVSEAYDEFSSRGYTMPPGALVARVDSVRQEAMLKAQATSREILIKAAEWEIENIRFAVQQGIACENVLVGIFMNGAARLFEAAKHRVDSELAIYNAQVALFNARQSAYATEATVFKARLEGELAKLEVFKAEIEGEKAKASLNEQKVRVYVAELDAVQKQVDIYRAKMEAARVQSELIKSQIDAYKADLEGYATRLNAEKVKFDAYEAQVRAEVAKVGIIDAEARAFAAEIEGYKTGADVEISKSRNVIERNKLIIEQFSALIEQDKARMQAQLSAVQSATARQQALTAAFQANASVDEARARLGVSVQEANIRNFLAYYEMQLKKYDAHMARLIEKAKVTIEGLKAAGQISGSLAAGAMAAMNVSAGLSGGAATNASFSGSIQETRQLN